MSESFNVVNQFIKENKLLVSFYFLLNIFTLFIETVVLSIILSEIYKTSKLDFYSIMNFMVVFLILKILSALKSYVYDLLTPAFQRFLKTYIFNSIIDKYKVDYKDLNTGYILFNFEALTKEFNEILVDVLREYIPISFSIVICLIYLFVLDLTVGFLCLLGIIVFIIMISVRSDEGVQKSRKQYKLFAKDSEHVQDKINNLFNIYVSGTEEEEKLSYSELKDVIQKATFENYFYYTASSIYTGVIISIITFLILLHIRKHDKLVLILVVYTKFLDFFKRSSIMMSYLIGMLGFSSHSDKFLLGISAKGIKYKNENSELKSLKGPIKFENVNFSYNKEHGENIFDNLSFVIKRNEKIAIFGKSGSGKSTLIKLLYGFYEINKGKITIEGININDINIDQLRKNMTMATQTVKIFEGTVLENILYGSIQTRASLKIKYGELLKIFKKLENGIDTKLAVNGSNISGGQRQIINVLRALAKNTPIVILDEPTVGLDEKTKTALLNVISNIKNKIVIIITHDKDVIKYVDKVYELTDGKLKITTP